MFDFTAAIKSAREELKNNQLGAILLGPSGAGKSTLLGTFGVKTLYLYTTGEDHGVKAAQARGADITGICLDFDGGNRLNADQTYARLNSILDSHDEIKKRGFKALAIDGASELEHIIRNTAEWRQRCLTDKGKHNAFQESLQCSAMFKDVMDKVKDLQRSTGVHYAMTCILDVKSLSDTGEILEATPRLGGYSVAESLVQQFPDILPIGRMVNGDKVAHRIQMLAGVSKTSKDQAGLIKKTINFTPRITGVLDLKGTYAANLAKIIEVKNAKEVPAADATDDVSAAS